MLLTAIKTKRISVSSFINIFVEIRINRKQELKNMAISEIQKLRFFYSFSTSLQRQLNSSHVPQQ